MWTRCSGRRYGAVKSSRWTTGDPQKPWHPGFDRRCGRGNEISPRLFTRPHSNREIGERTESPFAQSRNQVSRAIRRGLRFCTQPNRPQRRPRLVGFMRWQLRKNGKERKILKPYLTDADSTCMRKTQARNSFFGASSIRPLINHEWPLEWRCGGLYAGKKSRIQAPPKTLLKLWDINSSIQKRFASFDQVELAESLLQPCLSLHPP